MVKDCIISYHLFFSKKDDHAIQKSVDDFGEELLHLLQSANSNKVNKVHELPIEKISS